MCKDAEAGGVLSSGLGCAIYRETNDIFKNLDSYLKKGLDFNPVSFAF